MTALQKLCSQLQTYKVPLFLGTNLIPVLWKILHWNGEEGPGSVSRSPEVVSHLLPVLAGFNTQTMKPNFYVQITPISDPRQLNHPMGFRDLCAHYQNTLFSVLAN